MPFILDSFIVEKETPIFLALMKKYNLSQREAQRLIDKGRVFNNSKIVSNKGEVVKGKIKTVIFQPYSRGVKPIYKEKNFILFDKPSGILIHPKKMTTPYSLLDEIRTFGGDRANATHRLDKETSGLLIASTTKESEKFFKNAFEAKKIKKRYLAWVDGKTPPAFTVNEPISLRKEYNVTKHKVAINKEGKSAITHFKRIFYDNYLDSSLLEITPLTGRTHQIRIHLFHMKHPIIGDPLYKTSFEIATKYLEDRLSLEERVIKSGAPRLLLHAYYLEFNYQGYLYKLYSPTNFFEARKLIFKDREKKIDLGVNPSHHL